MPIGEEFVAGSDDEGYPFHVGLISRSDPIGGTGKSGAQMSKDVRSSTTTGSLVLPMSDSAFAGENSAPRPRPRPRPAYKGALVSEVISDKSSLEVPTAVASVPSSTVACAVPNTEDFPIPTYSPAVAERTKIRSRTTKKASISAVAPEGSPVRNSKKSARREKHSKRSVIMSDVIEITSDEDEYDELALVPSSSKSESNQLLGKGPSRTREALNRTGIPGLSDEYRSSSIQRAHISTSHSPLPPSDPPSSFSSAFRDIDHPPIAVLSNEPDSSLNLGVGTTHPSSSPPIGPSAAGPRKRKKRGVLKCCLDDGVDEEIRINTDRAVDSAGLVPPPFFASSDGDLFTETTSISSERARDVNGSRVRPSSNAKGKRKAADDDEWEKDSEPQVQRKAKGRPKKDPRAKKGKKPPNSTMVVVQEPLINQPQDSTQDVEHGGIYPEARISPSNALTGVELTRGNETGDILMTTAVIKGNAKSTSMNGDDTDVHRHEDLRRLDTTDPGASKHTGKRKSREEIAGGSDSSRDEENSQKENIAPEQDSVRTPANTKSNGLPSLLSSRTKSTPMSELIRKVNALPGSPFASSPSLSRSRTAGATFTAYSPYAKSSRFILSRIAPLHPNRRTPPPSLPRPPPPKKTKKQLELEEKWEEELSESVEGWACLTDEERAVLRRAKRAREEGWED